MFGDAEAIQTNFWGPKTLLCILPPSLVPGTVPVTIKDVESTKTNMFTYRDGNFSFSYFSHFYKNPIDLLWSSLFKVKKMIVDKKVTVTSGWNEADWTY